MQFSNKLNVYIEHGNHQYTMLFIKLGFTVVNNPENADLVCFTGGADVSPYLYKDGRHHTTHCDEWRDSKEQRLYDALVARNIPMVGICRGGQFLNVMNGGRMYQDVDNHCQSHFLTDVETGEVVFVSSTHHQMMMPSDKAQLVAFSELKGKRRWLDGSVPKEDVSNEDIEVVFYPDTKCLCFQPHPEFTAEAYDKMFNYFGNCLSRFLVKQ